MCTKELRDLDSDRPNTSHCGLVYTEISFLKFLTWNLTFVDLFVLRIVMHDGRCDDFVVTYKYL